VSQGAASSGTPVARAPARSHVRPRWVQRSRAIDLRALIAHSQLMRTTWLVAAVLAIGGAAAAEPQNNCGDSRLAKLRHYPVKLVSQQGGVKVQIQWDMKIAGHEECGTVDVPWQGSLPRGRYNLIVSVDGKETAQLGMTVGSTAKLQVVDVTPHKP
jgi:hypothetical protein